MPTCVPSAGLRRTSKGSRHEAAGVALAARQVACLKHPATGLFSEEVIPLEKPLKSLLTSLVCVASRWFSPCCAVAGELFSKNRTFYLTCHYDGVISCA